MSRILLTYGWCRTSYVFLKSLSSNGHEVFVCSHLHPSMAGWSRYAAGRANVSDYRIDPTGFIDDISALCRKWKIELIVPGHEDALLLSSHEVNLPNGVALACPPHAELRAAFDKESLTRAAHSAGIMVPESRFVKTRCALKDAAEELGYPVIAKLRHSNSAKGVKVINSQEDLSNIITNGFGDWSRESREVPYLQKFIEGGVVGSCFMAVEGNVIGYFGEHYLRAKSGGIGTSTYRTPLYDDNLESITRKLAGTLKWSGIGHFDFIRAPDTGELYLLEMNPRPWGAINLAWVNGQDFPNSLVDYHLGTGDPKKHFRRVVHPKNSLWLIGDGIRLVDLLMQKKWRESLRAIFSFFRSLPGSRFDDVSISDPLPLIAESICYIREFFRAGKQTNPQALKHTGSAQSESSENS